MISKKIIAMQLIAATVVLSACGSGTGSSSEVNTETETESVATADTEEISSSEEQSVSNTETETETEPAEMSELEKKIYEFKQNAPAETTVANDLLRGTWRVGEYEDFREDGNLLDHPKFGKMSISYDTTSAGSNITFTDSEFTMNFDSAEIWDQTERQEFTSLTISGLYNVTAEETKEEGFDEIMTAVDFLITDVSTPDAETDTTIYSELFDLIGNTYSREISFLGMHKDLDTFTEEELATYELMEPTIVYVGAGWGYRDDGSYGLMYYDDPIPSDVVAVTFLFIGDADTNEFATGHIRTKISNNCYDSEGNIISSEPGVTIFDVLDQFE